MGPAELSPPVFLAVLAAAAMHAGWNAILKLRIDPFLAANLISVCAALLALPALLWFGFPPPEAWPWLAGSVFVHLFYYWALTEAYRLGDMGQIYPIARGTAPFLTAIASLVLLREPIGLTAACGIAVLGMGIVYMAKNGGTKLVDMDKAAVKFALLTAVIISTYTVLDGLGARASETAHSYTAAYFVLDGIALLFAALWRHGWREVWKTRHFLGAGMAGGAMALGSYGIAIWAMTLAPIGVVAALRETSVLFAVAISTVVLKEKLTTARITAASLILAGIALLRL